MSRNHEVEYCNLDVQFDRSLIRNFVKSLIQSGYSLYWSECEERFAISIRSGRRLIKLKFEREAEKYKIVGNYSFRDEKLAYIIEKLIEDTRGHAVVKRFKDQMVTIENIMYGEMIRMVEINGIEHKVIYQRESTVTVTEVIEAFRCVRAEERIHALRIELDEALRSYLQAIDATDLSKREQIERTLESLRREMLSLEM